MSRHVATRPPVVPEGPWLTMSAAMTGLIPEYAGRDDLYVKIDPTAGRDDAGESHPGITFPELRLIEISGDYLPAEVDPDSVRMDWGPDHRRYPVLWGIFVHESAHGHFTLWVQEARKIISDALESERAELEAALGAALLLEEARAEGRHLKFRPQDREWQVAWAAKSALDEIENAFHSADDSRVGGRPLSLKTAGRAAALILARADAGILDPDDAGVMGTETEVKAALGEVNFSLAKHIWQEALAVADDDAQRMLALGKRWIKITGDSGDDSRRNHSGRSPLYDDLQQMVRDAQAEASGKAASGREERRVVEASRKLARAAAERERAAQAGKTLFNSNVPLQYRRPEPDEIALARRLARDLQNAYIPERVISRVPSRMPPGRVSMRAAMQAQAQRAMGQPVTAEPYTGRQRRHVPVPPLKVGIVLDNSSSQDKPVAATVSGAYSLARATAMIPDATVAMATFGPDVWPVIRPRVKVDQVPVVHAHGSTYHFLKALDAVEGVLDLTRPGSARLLVVISDGDFSGGVDTVGRDAWLGRLADAGVRVLWVQTAGGYQPTPPAIPGVRVFDATHSNQIPRLLAREAVAALKEGRE